MEKKTPLFKKHIELKAKMHPFAGFNMPIQYRSILDEHRCVREKVGLFDVSHMGEFLLEGEIALDVLQMLVPQDIEQLCNNQIMYCQLTNDDAGIVDDLLVYKYNDQKYLLVVNASRIDVDYNWIKQNIEKERFVVDFKNLSDEYSLLALQGPMAQNILSDMNFDNLPKYYEFKTYNNLMISRTGYTGEDGFEIMVKNEDACSLWDKLLNYGEKYGILPIGLGARDTLRLEAALLLYGQDMDEFTTPIEAGLGWSVAKNKIGNYNGKKIIKAQLENKPTKKLIGFVMHDRAIARHENEIYLNGKKIGVVTSGSISPTLNVNIGLGYIDEPLKIDDEIQIMIRGKLYSAKIVKRPFVEKVNKITR